MKKKLLIYTRIGIILFFMTSCKSVDDDTNSQIIGRITDKYLDYKNHGSMTIIYENELGYFKYQIDEWGVVCWNYLQIGDSIIKPAGTLTLRVKKPDGRYRDFEYKR